MTENLTKYAWQERMSFSSQVRCMWIFDTHVIFGHEKTFQIIESSKYRRCAAGRNDIFFNRGKKALTILKQRLHCMEQSRVRLQNTQYNDRAC